MQPSGQRKRRCRQGGDKKAMQVESDVEGERETDGETDGKTELRDKDNRV
jgi:hypothetical protein